MSLFSLDNILLNESNDSSSSNSSIDISDIGYLDTELMNHSFVQEGYDFILEMGRDYMNAEKTFYSNILGSYGDDNIITESFKGFFGKIKDIIKKFIEWIKKIFKEFVLKINSLFSSEKYIKKHHKLLNKFESQDEFEFKGYNFTRINDTTVPANTALSAFKNTDAVGYLSTDNWYDSTKNNLAINDDSTKDDRTEQTRKYNDKLDEELNKLNDGLDDFYEAFRGTVINKQEKYDSSEYAEVLFRFFRDEDDTPSDITIDASYVSAAYRRFENYKDTIKDIEKTQKNIIKDYEALEKHLDKLIKMSDVDNTFSIATSGNTHANSEIDVLTQGSGGKSLDTKTLYDKSSYDKMNSYLKVQSSKVSQMCSIHTQAFTAKLEAAKDQFKQDKKIIYKAIGQIIKRSNKADY